MCCKGWKKRSAERDVERQKREYEEEEVEG